MEILAENGFDDIESLRFLDLNTLVALGIENPQEVQEAIQSICEQFQEQIQEQDEQEEEYEYEGQQQILGGQMEEEPEDQIQELQPFEKTADTKPMKQITQQLIVQTLQQQQLKLSNSALQQYNKTIKGPQLQQTLSKLTHLHLNNKKIQRIGEELEQNCKNLKVLYLFDNIIQKIEGLNNMKNLIQLSLYNNQVSVMEGLEGLPSLRRLYLEKNRISKLEGLTACRNLEELYLSQQDIQTNFTFDEYSLAAIAGSLQYLDLSDSRVVDSKPLYYLERLEVLILKKNRISDFEENICPLLQTMSSLSKLDLTDNPVNQIPKYRDQIIILTENRLSEVDNKKVTQQERTYLRQLVQRKQRQPFGTTNKEEKKQFEIQGKNKQIHENQAYEGGPIIDTQNKFYSPLDEGKNVLKQRTANIANQSYQNNAIMKKRSINLNANNDFTTAGMSHMPTKHIPTMAMKSTNGSVGQKK